MLRDLTCVAQDLRILHAERECLLHFGIGLRVVSAGGERPSVGVQRKGIVAARQFLPGDL